MYTQYELEAYLEEALSPSEMGEMEAAIRDDAELGKQLVEIIRRRDAGIHSLGSIWRRHRISCPGREQLGSFLLGALDGEELNYIHFHIKEIGCRVCNANLEDLQRQQQETNDTAKTRRDKYFQSTAGYIEPGEK